MDWFIQCLARVQTAVPGNPANPEAPTGWETWPFSGFGTLGFWGLLLKALFVTVIFLALAYTLRRLFRPGSRLRGEGWETIEEARERRARESEAHTATRDDANADANADADTDANDARGARR